MRRVSDLGRTFFDKYRQKLRPPRSSRLPIMDTSAICGNVGRLLALLAMCPSCQSRTHDCTESGSSDTLHYQITVYAICLAVT